MLEKTERLKSFQMNVKAIANLWHESASDVELE